MSDVRSRELLTTALNITCMRIGIITADFVIHLAAAYHQIRWVFFWFVCFSFLFRLFSYLYFFFIFLFFCTKLISAVFESCTRGVSCLFEQI